MTISDDDDQRPPPPPLDLVDDVNSRYQSFNLPHPLGSSEEEDNKRGGITMPVPLRRHTIKGT